MAGSRPDFEVAQYWACYSCYLRSTHLGLKLLGLYPLGQLQIPSLHWAKSVLDGSDECLQDYNIEWLQPGSWRRRRRRRPTSSCRRRWNRNASTEIATKCCSFATCSPRRAAAAAGCDASSSNSWRWVCWLPEGHQALLPSSGWFKWFAQKVKWFRNVCQIPPETKNLFIVCPIVLNLSSRRISSKAPIRRNNDGLWLKL